MTALLAPEDVAGHLASVGVPIVRERLVDDAGAAAATAVEFGGRVALKLVDPDLVHKSDVGGVLLDVAGPDVVAAAGRLADRAADLGLRRWRILVQEMVTGVEVLVGLTADPVFGPVVVVGAGGRLVELLGGRAFATCPVDVREAAALLRATPLGTVLGGYRGHPDVLDEVAAVVAAASRLPERVPGLVETDLNPLVVTGRGPVVVDARIVVDDEHPPGIRARTRRHRDLGPLFAPRSVAVLGASTSATVRPGNRVLRYLRRHRFPGRVVAVHPTATEVDGWPAVPRLDALPHGSVDLVCVVVAAAGCVDVVEQAGTIGAPAVLVISSGFSEAGDGEEERRLVEAADRHGIALCGPNSVGVMSPGEHVFVGFSQAQEMVETPAGGVAMVMQSGALGGSLASQAWERGVGISRFVSVGNQAALDVADYLTYLADDPTTRTIAVLLEGVPDGRALLAAVEWATAAGKRVLVFKNGRSEVGARAVRSHTGAVAGDYAVYRALLERSGATMVDGITELLDALVLRHRDGGLAQGARVGIVSTSGGVCSVSADLCDRYGFAVPVFGDALQAELRTVLPAFATSANPVDTTAQVTADLTILDRTLAPILGSTEVDAVLVAITTVADPMASEIAGLIVERAAASTTPVLVVWTIAAELAPRGLAVLRDAGIPVFDDPARALHAARSAG